ncbi:hypothetical protein FRC08_004676 [Ceratobasidium sp. 394]|nr:hypothetical protein FRC08_004676 [Ceratobasidium sp. 394]
MYFNRKGKPHKRGAITVANTISNNVTIFTQHPASAPETPHRPSLLVSRAKRVTKAQLAEIQRKAKRRNEELLREELSRVQMRELESLREQISGRDGMDVEMSGYAEPEDDWVDDEGSPDAAADNGCEEAEAIVEDLGLPPSNTKWKERLSTEHEAWQDQLPALCDAYIAYRTGMGLPGSEGSGTLEAITLVCVDVRDEMTRSFKLFEGDSNANVVLLRHGYLSATPSRPTIAFSLDLLDILAAVQRRSPAVSIEAMSKAFCDLRNIPYTPHSRTRLSSALDVYYMVNRVIKKRVDKAMGRDSPDWRLKNCCPPCMYILEGEPELNPKLLATCDGNDSLKRCARAGSADQREYESDYYISPEEVDRFKDEVANSRRGKQKSKSDDGGEEKTECEKRWKNAGADGKPKKPVRFFEETGVFASLCRHSCPLTICDMIRSGELAKYALATVDKLMRVFGPHILLGYDIACSFVKTLARSILLGGRVKDLAFDVCLGTFHGPAHIRRCQVLFHALNRAGTGLTDFENCETLFSSSNRVAATTRLASKYHRHQRIDLFLGGWEDDAYNNLGSLLRRKYTHALKVHAEASEFLAKFPSVGEELLCRLFQQEKDYLSSYKTAPPENTFAITYIGLLERLAASRLEYEAHITTPARESGEGSRDLRRAMLLSQLELKRQSTLDQLLTLQSAVEKLESEHGITERWTPGSTEWVDAQHLRANQRYYQCLDDLEHLVVGRILEMNRAGRSGTNYKMRAHIMKSITARSSATKNAMKRYNEAAAALSPPAPSIKWEDITTARILDDFPILRDSRRLLLSQDWTNPNNRRCVEQYHRLLRAQEEITRLNVEIRRLSSSIADEEVHLPATLADVRGSSPELAWFVERLVTRRISTNKLLLRDLDSIRCLPGYTGWHTNGTRLNASKATATPGNVDDRPTSENQPHDRHCEIDRQRSSAPGQGTIDSEEDMGEGLEVDDTLVEQFEEWQTTLERVVDGMEDSE